MIAAITLEGVTATMTVRGGVKGRDFKRFVFKKLIPSLYAGDIVLWDNLNVHKNADVREGIEQVGATVVQLPRYSPDLNPIEPAWGKVKDWIRKMRPGGVAELRDLMRRGLRRIRSSDALGWFNYCGYGLP